MESRIYLFFNKWIYYSKFKKQENSENRVVKSKVLKIKLSFFNFIMGEDNERVQTLPTNNFYTKFRLLCDKYLR